MKLKDLIKNQRGLGDTVESITKATGIKTVVEKTTKVMGKEDCGCSRRRDELNKRFSYKK